MPTPDTGDLVFGAAGDVTALADDSEVELTTGVNAGRQVLESLEIVGPPEGSALLIRASDFNPEFDVSLGSDFVQLIYYLSLYDDTSPFALVAEDDCDALIFVDAGSFVITTAAQNAQLELVVTGLVPDHPYQVDLSFEQVDDGSSLSEFLNLVSASRRITVQEVRR